MKNFVRISCLTILIFISGYFYAHRDSTNSKCDLYLTISSGYMISNISFSTQSSLYLGGSGSWEEFGGTNYKGKIQYSGFSYPAIELNIVGKKVTIIQELNFQEFNFVIRNIPMDWYEKYNIYSQTQPPVPISSHTIA